MKRNFTSKTAQAGFTAIEMMVVLIVGIILLAAGGATIAKMFSANQLQTEVSNYSQVILNTKSLRSSGGYGTAATDLVPSLIATDGIPKTMSVVSAKPQNAWGGEVTVVSTGAGFTLTTPAVPKAACIELATKISRGGAVTTTIGATTAVTGEMDLATATTNCASATANSIAFGVTG